MASLKNEIAKPDLKLRRARTAFSYATKIRDKSDIHIRNCACISGLTRIHAATATQVCSISTSHLEVYGGVSLVRFDSDQMGQQDSSLGYCDTLRTSL